MGLFLVPIRDVKPGFFYIPIKSGYSDLRFRGTVQRYDVRKRTVIPVRKFYRTAVIYRFLGLVFHAVDRYGTLLILDVRLPQGQYVVDT